MGLVYLDSVGAYMNTNTGETFPSLADGTPDFCEEMRVHLDDVCDEWMSSLSKEDYNMVMSVGAQNG